MGAVIDEAKYISMRFKPRDGEVKEKLERVKQLEAEVEKLKEEIVKTEETRILVKIMEHFPQVKVQDLKIYQVYVEVERTIEDFKLAVLTIEDIDYALVVESYCEYIDPYEEIKHFGDDFCLEFGDDLAEKLSKLIYEEDIKAYRETRLIY